ncbi:hypothetical protein TVAG_406340 [Trichomonas vaginalis G3]|uniref:Uncharacterized protein n=1 Tax=Trichomonas vaginalis (strain ATCC PRA-98 / G3) TaxID=412133 RepID=A2FNZ0_TRIV3|nr:hypothetical protein TVAG_406340 [Trichomonas vaginalis G3]|eukprot:XP_001306300.1 hypothetical protein [Trichomonas vaginalis G3]
MLVHQSEIPGDVWQIYGTENQGDYVKLDNPTVNLNSNKECFVYNCKFISFTTQHPIDFNSVTDAKFMHSNCLFNTCNSATNGGAVQFVGDGSSEIIQRRFCALSCKLTTASTSGHFSYTTAAASSNYMNYIIESSIYGSRALQQGYGVFSINNGLALVSSTNMTGLSANTQSTVLFKSVSSQSKLNFSNIYSVISAHQALTFNTATGTVQNSNFVKMNQNTANVGLIYLYQSQNVLFDGCIFDQNDQNHYLFSVFKYTLTVVNSYIESRVYMSSLYQATFTTSDPIDDSATHLLSFYGTFKDGHSIG